MGHVTPVEPILEMLDEVDGYMYCDDAHGFSVIGEHGRGSAMPYFRQRPHRGIVVVSLNKSFGTNRGAAAVPTPDDLALIVNLRLKRYQLLALQTVPVDENWSRSV